MIVVDGLRCRFVTHARNFAASPFGAPFVTIQKLRTPRYWPDLALRRLHGDALVADRVDAAVNANDTKPIALLVARHTAFCSRPLEVFAVALGEIFRFSPRKMCWKASCVPEAPSRSNRSIGPVICAPGTWLQSRIAPVKMPSTVLLRQVGDRVLTGS